MSKRIVVVGHGMVGQRFLETLTQDGSSDFAITMLAEEPRLAYDRVNLSKYFSGSTVEDLTLTTREFFDKNGIELYSGDPVFAVDRANKRVTTRSGAEYEYDILILATGSSPFVPPIPGRDRPGVFVYRTIEDLEAITEAGKNSTRGVVIGGGLLGLEAAKALKDLGLATNVVEFAPRLMAVQVDEGGGGLLRSRIEALGVAVHTGKNTTRIDDGETARHRMHFADGGSLETDVVVISAGIRPRDELARACGLEVAPRGGIVINGDCRTSDESIYAIGECAAYEGRVFGLVAPGYQMARIAASRVLGTEGEVFAGADMSTKLKLLGVEVGSIGDAHGTTVGARVYSFFDQRKEVYKKLVVDAEGKKLIGAVLVGDTSDYSMWHQTVANAMPLPENPETMLFPAAAASAGAPPTNALAALPATAQVCSCNNVSKGGLCSAIEAGCTTVGALKTKTKAGTTCGGCTPLVTQILNAELKKRGVNVNTSMCEHFPFTRQQLFHLVRINELKTFEDLIARHGRGLGCDICKPAVASIMASCWNEFVLKKRHAALQDTNDYFLANMQKDGTYSVVPRVPGGEITPEKLIVIGQVAKKYGLYTKITGGQRIDLFGAQLHELPLIWRELIDAGMESGHAYGKALRTVKSCVGSTWCRYGVQDSVGLAIDLENRYKGLRAPHKIKFAVSGCTRECAEAQSKDVGVIAVEGGWNLYVSGNGGMKPRHGDLLARELDTPTLIKYIDRYLMFYIRTADRLQRTSTWLENLEGGIEYVRKVVCEDSLGIGAELESDMARVIGTYACEWKVAVEDPATLKRFRTFVNSDEKDQQRGVRRGTRPDSSRQRRRTCDCADARKGRRRGRGMSNARWHEVCALEELIEGAGVAALVGGRQIALFQVHGRVYALDNFDPSSRANVLSRGLTGNLQGERVVASPIYKNHFALTSGRCVEDPTFNVSAYTTRITDGRVFVEAPETQKRTRLVVAGNGMAGMRTVEELLKLGIADRFSITVFGAEPRGNYNRILLSPVLSGEQQADDIMLHRPNWYTRRGITLHSGDPIVAIDRKRRTVRSKSGLVATYDRLLIATGSDPIMLPLPGKELPGVVTFRDLDDVNRMLERSGAGRRAVVIGGGLLGLEAAHGLSLRGMHVTVVHLLDTLMERQLDASAGALLKAALEKRGLEFRMRAKTQAILGGERVTGVKFESGEEVAADLVVMAVGVRPNIDLAKKAHLACDRGILVDDTLQTYDPAIYAVGECVQHRRQTFGLVAPLWEQARISAQHIAEIGVSRFSGAINSTQLKVSGIEVFSAGDFSEQANRESLVLSDNRRGIYKRVVLEGNKVCGAVLFGDVSEASRLRDLIADKTDIGPIRDQLLFDSSAAA